MPSGNRSNAWFCDCNLHFGHPIDGPCAMTQVGMKDGEFVINPSQEVWDNGDLQLTVASTREKVIMIEAGANEIPEDK